MWRALRSTSVRTDPEVESRWTVRLPQPGDSRALAEAELLCFSDPWPPQFFVSEMLADGRFNRILVDSAGRMGAYLFCVWQYLDLRVLKVATLPEQQRAGLARRLMELAEDHAETTGGERLTLEVRHDNEPAIALYETLGYSHQEIRPHYYPSGDDAIIMSKKVRDLARTSHRVSTPGGE